MKSTPKKSTPKKSTPKKSTPKRSETHNELDAKTLVEAVVGIWFATERIADAAERNAEANEKIADLLRLSAWFAISYAKFFFPGNKADWTDLIGRFAEFSYET